jgi:SAM-dependent methyltransferase
MGRMNTAERVRATGQFCVHDIDALVECAERYQLHRDTPWDDFDRAHLILPEWFRPGLDPLTAEYASQQQRLWSLITGLDRPYTAEIDEQDAPLGEVDAIRRPGYYIRRDPHSVTEASEHVIATGMILKHCGLEPGDTALEYGAGFGPVALTLARLGIVVDTVDISKTFCGYVQQQADFFQVPLTPFLGQFGWNPRPGHRYRLIFFFQAFHHCADFLNVIRSLKAHLADDGRILLVGEPLMSCADPYVPYPWGLKLDAVSVAQMRRYHWFEMGFTEEFLVRVFANAGFLAQRFKGPPESWCDIYQFEHRTNRIELSKSSLPEWLGWHLPEAAGRWTTARSRLLVDSGADFGKLVLKATNHHPFTQTVEIEYGRLRLTEPFRAGQSKEIVIPALEKGAEVLIQTTAYVPAKDYPRRRRMPDPRALGLFVHSLSYQ